MKPFLRNFEEDKPLLQAEINGEKIYFDGQSDDDLQTSKEFYSEARGWQYLGSSRISYCNGYRHESENERHFFVRS